MDTALTPQAASRSMDLPAPRTQTEMRRWAFAKRLLEVVDVGAAYRDVFNPGNNVEPRHVVAGNKLLKEEDVGKIVAYLAEPALVAAGVEREFAIKRLVAMIDGDITDFADDEGSFMDLKAMKDLPPEKRRLVRKYGERFGATGSLTSRTLELEPRIPALELMARILKLVQPVGVTVNNNTANVFSDMTKEQLLAEIARKMANPDVARALEARIIEHNP